MTDHHVKWLINVVKWLIIVKLRFKWLIKTTYKGWFSTTEHEVRGN